jgi:hypothetical protein
LKLLKDFRKKFGENDDETEGTEEKIFIEVWM